MSFAEAAVLSYLMQHQDEICTKEVLLQEGWPDRVVAPSSLIQCVSTLRKKLEPFSEVNLKTVARRGYQVVVGSSRPASEEQLEEANGADAAPRPTRRKATPLVAIGAIAATLVVAALVYQLLPRLYVSSSVSDWSWIEQGELRIGSEVGPTELLASSDQAGPELARWQRHFDTSSNRSIIKDYKAFALTDGKTDSISICPGFDGECPGKDIININFPTMEKVKMDLPVFFELAKIMEQRIRYNRIELPSVPFHQGELTEHMYSADVYFPRNDQLLVRVDHNISMVYKDESKGLFFASFCITDQDCLTSPIKYNFEGEFTRYSAKIGGHQVDVFKVETQSRNLLKPEKVTQAALPFYRELRRQSLSEEPLYFYRFYQDEHSAAWVIPFYGYSLAWMKKSTMAM
ncbi:winged helix-turn-helix domain-containing protein [Ferrimonas sediminicola]|uniref:winged helix-turn-helix domain-containing protein n=1 Tax=Ferrimonas sediminicola TaxID=2569538 RepID=UPI00145D1C7F|nr:winged helix-turn-helix domain-containing protein [Ferrimonas sediminicola]